MKNLIPKKIKGKKYQFWRSITIVDFLIITIWVTLSFLFVFGFQWKLWIKMIVVTLMSIAGLPLTYY